MIVVDASVALAWVLNDTEENYRYSDTVAEAGRVGGRLLIGPQVLLGERAYVLLQAGRREKWGAVLTAEKAEIISAFGIWLFGESRDLADIVQFGSPPCGRPTQRLAARLPGLRRAWEHCHHASAARAQPVEEGAPAGRPECGSSWPAAARHPFGRISRRHRGADRRWP